MSKVSLDELVSYLKNLGYVYQGSEIYGGLANAWDFGPLGVELKNNIKKLWWKKFIQESQDNVGLDSAILMNKKVWEATGHVKSFNDPLMDCKDCKSRFRADKLIEDYSKGEVSCDGMSNIELMDFIKKHEITCPNCGSKNFSDIRQFNMMFKTNQGVIIDENNTVYLRPETAQGIFINFKNIQRSMRKKLPFGVGQIGKAFRNEITPGNFIFRTREFEQMEFEFFCKPGSEILWFNYYRSFCFDFLTSLGVKKEELRYRDHEKKELAFYSNATTDIEYNFPWGFGEVWGIASRTDYDLKKHQEYSKESFIYLDPLDNSKYIPYVVEPSVGVERIMLTVLFSAYEKEIINEKEEREVLHLIPALAPYKVAILPLLKKYHGEKAIEVYKTLSKHFMCVYDDTQNIGKRYRRQDAIGTPFAVTIDDNTLSKDIVTIRFRDSMEQISIKLDELVDFIEDKIKF